MAQETSALWKSLWRTRGTLREYQFDIDGTIYGPEAETEHSVDSGLFDEFSIGNAATAKLTLSLFANAIPRAAQIKRYVRLVNGNQVSEWLPKGVFFVNRRSEEDGRWTIEAFDAMRKAERSWEPSQSLTFPMSMRNAVNIFAQLMGVEVDPRTQVSTAYTIDYPASDPESETGEYYTIRQELQWIAAAHGGNWIITDEGKLLLVPLLSIPPETFYLVDEYGDPITFGGDRILVG